MSDADDTQPNRTMLPAVTILLEVAIDGGDVPCTRQDVFATWASGEAEALRRYDAEAPGREDRLLLDDVERAAARERWLHHLRRNRPVHLDSRRTLRLKTLAVKP